MIRFDEAEHKYYDGEKELISVTTLLRKHGLAPDYSGVSQEVLNRKAERGTLIHEEIENFNKTGEIGFTREVDEFANYLLNHGLKRDEIKVIASEQIVYNDIVAGKFDLLIEDNGEIIIADIKTTYSLHKESVAWQLSLYAYLLKNYVATKGQAFHFDKDGNLNVVDIPLKPKEEVEKLLEAERKGEKYNLPMITLEDNQVAVIQELSEIIQKADNEKKEAESRLNEIKESILSAMEENGVKSFENDYFKITYVAAVEKTTIDSARLKKELPEVAEQYSKKGLQKASVRITLKEQKQ